MPYETVLYEKKGQICYITLNRPEALNAINDTLCREVGEALLEFDVDDDVAVAILSGKGRCFCAGADVKQRQSKPREELRKRGGPGGLRPNPEMLTLGATVNWKPVIAAVHSYALGAGLAIAMECDLVVASEDAKFEITEVHRGLPGGEKWVYVWSWGGARLANELIMTGRRFSAQEALARGMINRVVPTDQLLVEAEKMAQEVLRLPPLSVRSGVRISRWFVREMARTAQMHDRALNLHLTEDFEESVKSFVEKRPPVYKGR